MRASRHDQLRERVRHLTVGPKVGLDVPLNGERHVRMPDALAQRLPVNLRIAARGGVSSGLFLEQRDGRSHVAWPGTGAGLPGKRGR
jgi:hypothetical protein